MLTFRSKPITITSLEKCIHSARQFFRQVRERKSRWVQSWCVIVMWLSFYFLSHNIDYLSSHRLFVWEACSQRPTLNRLRVKPTRHRLMWKSGVGFNYRIMTTWLSILFIYYTPDGSIKHSNTNSRIHSCAKIKNIKNTEIIWRKSQIHRLGKWVPNQFSDRVVWQFERLHIIQTNNSDKSLMHATKLWHYCT